MASKIKLIVSLSALPLFILSTSFLLRKENTHLQSASAFRHPSPRPHPKFVDDLNLDGNFTGPESIQNRRKRILLSSCRRYKHTEPFHSVSSRRELEGLHRHYLWFEMSHGLAYCGVAKTGSTTWVTHVAQLAGRNFEQYKKNLLKKYEWRLEHPVNGSRPAKPRPRAFFKRRYFSLPSNRSMAWASRNLFAFTFVRDPFARLASAYYQKLSMHLAFSDLKAVWLDIVKNFRQGGARRKKPLSAKVPPKPKELVQYILYTARTKGPDSLDAHLRPQWTVCPFCSFDFDFIGNTETFDDDRKNILQMLSAPKERMSWHTHANFHRPRKVSPSQVVKKFFSRVPKAFIRRLYSEVYKIDFDFFDYPPPDFDVLGV